MPHSLWNIVIFKGDMNVVKWCKKCGKVTWRIISTIVDRSKSVATNHKEIALAAILPTPFISSHYYIYSNRNKVIAIKEGISSLTYWKSKAENIHSKNRGAGALFCIKDSWM